MLDKLIETTKDDGYIQFAVKVTDWLKKIKFEEYNDEGEIIFKDCNKKVFYQGSYKRNTDVENNLIYKNSDIDIVLNFTNCFITKNEQISNFYKLRQNYQEYIRKIDFSKVNLTNFIKIKLNKKFSDKIEEILKKEKCVGWSVKRKNKCFEISYSNYKIDVAILLSCKFKKYKPRDCSYKKGITFSWLCDLNKETQNFFFSFPNENNINVEKKHKQVDYFYEWARILKCCLSIYKSVKKKEETILKSYHLESFLMRIKKTLFKNDWKIPTLLKILRSMIQILNSNDTLPEINNILLFKNNKKGEYLEYVKELKKLNNFCTNELEKYLQKNND